MQILICKPSGVDSIKAPRKADCTDSSTDSHDMNCPVIPMVLVAVINVGLNGVVIACGWGRKQDIDYKIIIAADGIGDRVLCYF